MLAKDRFGGVKNGKFINAGCPQKANLVLDRRPIQRRGRKEKKKH